MQHTWISVLKISSKKLPSPIRTKFGSSLIVKGHIILSVATHFIGCFIHFYHGWWCYNFAFPCFLVNLMFRVATNSIAIYTSWSGPDLPYLFMLIVCLVFNIINRSLGSIVFVFAIKLHFWFFWLQINIFWCFGLFWCVDVKNELIKIK